MKIHRNSPLWNVRPYKMEYLSHPLLNSTMKYVIAVGIKIKLLFVYPWIWQIDSAPGNFFIIMKMCSVKSQFHHIDVANRDMKYGTCGVDFNIRKNISYSEMNAWIAMWPWLFTDGVGDEVMRCDSQIANGTCEIVN